jgi:hypothetical protein
MVAEDMEMTKDTKALALEALLEEMRMPVSPRILGESGAIRTQETQQYWANRIEAALATPAEPVRCDNAKTDEPCEPCIMCNARGHFGGKFKPPATKAASESDDPYNEMDSSSYDGEKPTAPVEQRCHVSISGCKYDEDDLCTVHAFVSREQYPTRGEKPPATKAAEGDCK